MPVNRNQPATYSWPPQDLNAFCLAQNVAAGARMVLNGTLTAPSITTPGTVNTINPGFRSVSRSISVTTNFNLGGTITITGTLFGLVKSEVMNPAPQTETLETAGLFDTITSVVPSNAAAGADTIRVGSGTIGNTRWFLVDEYRPYPALTVDMNVSGNTINYTFVSSVADPTRTNVNFAYRQGIVGPNPDNDQAFTTYMSGATTSQLACLNTPTLYACIVVNSSDATGAFTATFVQQGIR